MNTHLISKFGPAWPIAAAILCGVFLAPNSYASLIGTVATAPASTVFPGFVPPGTNPGTLLAAETEPWSYATTSGTNSGELESAVFMEAGGTLDFYYQVTNDATSATAIARETDTDFSSQASNISTGFRVDGSTLPGGFVDGTVTPLTADLNATGSVAGFSFTPPTSAAIAPGAVSYVLVVSTDATTFTDGNASVLDGGVTTVPSFQPAVPVSHVPEPNSAALLGGGLLALIGLSGRRRGSAQKK